MRLEAMTLGEITNAVHRGEVPLDAAYQELRRRPNLDRDWRPGDPLPCDRSADRGELSNTDHLEDLTDRPRAPSRSVRP